MHIKYCLLLLVLSYAPLRAQISTLVFTNAKDAIVFMSPNDGDTHVPAKTTIIVRPKPQVARGRSPKDFSFTVTGRASGIHTGKVLISDDNETVIFKPYEPFTLNEPVDVALRVAGLENLTPHIYSFRITSMSEADQIESINAFRESESLEIRKLVNQGLSLGQGDSLNTHKYTIDKIVPDLVAPGDLYTTSNGTESFLETLSNEGMPLYRQQVFNPPCENFRPWRNTYYSYIYQNKVFLLDSNHGLIKTFECGNGYHADDHDFYYLPNGHGLLMAYEARDTDMRKITGDSTSTPKGMVLGGIIQEVDQNGNVVFQWRALDHFQVSDVAHFDTHNPLLRTIDFCHVNSVREDTDGNLIASFRNMDEITKINRSSGKIIWRWGGKNNIFTFANGSEPFCYQHDITRIPNGHITMMDNGNYRQTTWGDGSKHDTAWSRAIEYDLNEETLTATPVWEYSKIDFAAAAGNVQRLPNGNTFILAGHFGVQKGAEVTPDGEVVFQITFPPGVFTFMMYRFVTPNGSPNAVPSNTTSAAPLKLQNIYPNPAQSSATVTFSSVGRVARIELLDVLGQTVLLVHKELDGTGCYAADLDLRGLSEGMYLCKISVNGNVTMQMVSVRK